MPLFLQKIFCFRKWLTYLKEPILSIQHRFYQVCWQLCEHPRQFSMLLSSGLQVRKSPSSLVLGWLSYQEHDLLRSKMQENGIFSSGSPPMAECVRTLMSARRIRPAKYIFSNFWQFFLSLDSPDWLIISIFEWVINDCKLSGLWALPQYKRWSQVRRCLLSSGYYCQNQKEISVRPITRDENDLRFEKMLPQYFWSGLRPRGRACKQM